MKATLVGIAAWVLFAPLMFAIALVLAISIVGIPLLLLVPFAVLALLLMALVGFSGTAFAVGQWTRRHAGIGAVPAGIDVCLGILVIMLPLLLGRIVGLAGWGVGPLVFLLVAIGLTVEFLAWSSGLGAVITNAFGRWQAKRAMRTPPRRRRPRQRPPATVSESRIVKLLPVGRGLQTPPIVIRDPCNRGKLSRACRRLTCTAHARPKVDVLTSVASL